MSRIILLDSGPLGLITHKKGVPLADACRQWIGDCLANGAHIVVPEITDYEVRRELVRAGLTASIAWLDTFNSGVPDRFLPITSDAMRLAADLWALARNGGWATADPHALDGDVILAAQALRLGLPPGAFLVATTNVAHLSRYLAADQWQNIPP